MSVSGSESRTFDEIYQEYHVMVYKLSLKYSDCNEHLADDATQHTFLKLFQAMQQGTQIENIRTYLHTIVKNFTLNSVERVRRSDSLDMMTENDELELLMFQSAEFMYIESEEAQYIRTLAHMILEELKKKNEIWFQIVFEAFYKGRNQTEVARELGMNNTAMYATVRRIKKWADKNKIKFEQKMKDRAKEVSKGHLFSL